MCRTAAICMTHSCLADLNEHWRERRRNGAVEQTAVLALKADACPRITSICCSSRNGTQFALQGTMKSDGKKPDSHQQPVIREILRYLIEHPGAKDSIDGVIWWWLPRECLKYRDEDVLQALNHLVSRRWVIASRVTKSTVVYGVVAARLGEIRRFLNITAAQDRTNAK